MIVLSYGYLVKRCISTIINSKVVSPSNDIGASKYYAAIVYNGDVPARST
ncbi:hypothetical protein CAAN1_01S07976 [[Candida] anglica]|uniref:Uncharacterized protein n=1 Tax=[Candida] anglica TaxID=148631 RepID=A0ABP0EK12_9ASCO